MPSKRTDIEGGYNALVEPGEFEDDALLNIWYVEYWNPSGHEAGESPVMTWAEACAYADQLFEMVEPEDVEYVIHRAE